MEFERESDPRLKDRRTVESTTPTSDVIGNLVDSESFQPVKFSNLERKALLLKEESGDEVSQVVDRPTGRIYTLKEFSSPFDSSLGTQISGEFHNLEKLNHPNLVKCYQLFQIGGRISLLLERLDHVSLVDASITNPSYLASVAFHVLLGLNYLHENKIWHGEVKPSNIFIDSEKKAKVLYLGKFMSKTFELSKIEAIHDDFSWDIWNLGLSILKLFSFSSSPAARKPSEEMCKFLDCCMAPDLSRTWTAGALLGHPIFFGIDLLKDHSMGQMTESASELHGLYHLNLSSSKLSSLVMCSSTTSPDLIHLHLGHHSLSKLHSLVPAISHFSAFY